MSGRKVTIIGGGVAGMSAAHELVERGFEVTILEKGAVAGGKARSIAVPGSGTGGRPDLPGEHGFRFFPGFYRHLPDTMMRIPYRNQLRGVFDNLVDATQIEMRTTTQRDVIAAEFPTNRAQLAMDLTAIVRNFFNSDPGLSVRDVAYFVGRILAILCSCDERRMVEYESQSWWDFCHAEQRSVKYQRYLADGLSRTLVACKARDLSARTGGITLAQLLLDLVTPGGRSDRVLNGPTSEVWIQPWLAHLRGRGVGYELGSEVTRIDCEGGRVTGVTHTTPGGLLSRIDDAGHCIAAVPKEIMERLVRSSDGLAAADPGLARIGELQTSWMNGVMFYLRATPAMVYGHTLYIDSPWALTSISQRQFWTGVDLRTMGDGKATGILSVIISDWEQPGELHRKPATECSGQEIVEEVRHQLQLRGVPGLAPANVVRSFIDDDIAWRHPNNPSDETNAEPLLINTVDSWAIRPAATTAIANLFLASDYVQTHTDVATMEAANEAARRAVNGILAASGSDARPCDVWPLSEPRIFERLRAADRDRFAAEQRRAHLLPQRPYSALRQRVRPDPERELRGVPAPPPPTRVSPPAAAAPHPEARLAGAAP